MYGTNFELLVFCIAPAQPSNFKYMYLNASVWNLSSGSLFVSEIVSYCYLNLVKLFGGKKAKGLHYMTYSSQLLSAMLKHIHIYFKWNGSVDDFVSFHSSTPNLKCVLSALYYARLAKKLASLHPKNIILQNILSNLIPDHDISFEIYC